MTYSKPEIQVLGDANSVIQGGKSGGNEDISDTKQHSGSFELED